MMEHSFIRLNLPGLIDDAKAIAPTLTIVLQPIHQIIQLHKV
jgi:hypothetical protein